MAGKNATGGSRRAGWRALGLFLALAAALAAAAAGPALAAARPPLRGELVDIGGRSIRILCAGPASARPLIIFEAGIFGGAASWDAVQTRLTAKGTRSCAYDRAGAGFSDPGPMPRDAKALVGDLEAWLRAKGETGPYVLVGHSMAGLETRMFAERHPGQVEGLVMVDTTSATLAGTHDGRVFLKSYVAFARLLRVLTCAGVLDVLAPWIGDSEGLKGEAHTEQVYFFGRRSHQRGAILEIQEVYPRAKQALSEGPLDPDIPVTAIVLAGEPGESLPWSPARSAEARASRRGAVITVTNSEHPRLIGPDHADTVVEAIETVLTAAAARRAAQGG